MAVKKTSEKSKVEKTAKKAQVSKNTATAKRRAKPTPKKKQEFAEHERDVLTALAAALSVEFVPPMRFQQILGKLTVFELAFVSKVARRFKERFLTESAEAAVEREIADECNRE